MQYYAISVLTPEGIVKDLTPYYQSKKRAKDKMTLSGAFGKIRRMAKYNSFGDYPLLYCSLLALQKIGVRTSHKKLLSVIYRHTTELRGRFRGKNKIIENLEPLLV